MSPRELKTIIKRNRKALGLPSSRADVNYMLLLNNISEILVVRLGCPELGNYRCFKGLILADGVVVGFEEEYDVR